MSTNPLHGGFRCATPPIGCHACGLEATIAFSLVGQPGDSIATLTHVDSEPLKPKNAALVSRTEEALILTVTNTDEYLGK